jgi:cytochrome c biogenesis protein CcmG, thiol:disulfide interchange protein DsbE
MTIRLASLTRPVAVAALIALAGCAANTQAAGPPSKGRLAPQWTEPMSTGGQLSSASLRGKPVYLNFFASWCPPCNEEAPSVNALQKKYAPKGLVVVGVDVQENAAKAESFRKQHNLSYATVVDSGTLRDAYSVNGLPVHVFIDRKGVVQNITIGEMSPSQIENQIQRVVR